jgi:hypothetical protein
MPVTTEQKEKHIAASPSRIDEKAYLLQVIEK